MEYHAIATCRNQYLDSLWLKALEQEFVDRAASDYQIYHHKLLSTRDSALVK